MIGTILTQFSADELKSLIVEAVRETIPPTPQKLYTTKEASQKLGITTITLHTWKKEGKVNCLRIGNRLMFEEQELARLIKEVPRLRNRL